MSIFEQVPAAPQDGTFALMGAFKVDPSEEKVNLVPGIYRDEQAKTWVLPSVKEVKQFCSISFFVFLHRNNSKETQYHGELFPSRS